MRKISLALCASLLACSSAMAGPTEGVPFNISCKAAEYNNLNAGHVKNDSYSVTVPMVWGEDNFKNPIAQGQANFSADKAVRLTLQFGTFRTSAYLEATTAVAEWNNTALNCHSSGVVFGSIDTLCTKPDSKDYSYRVTCYTNSWAGGTDGSN